MPPLDAEEVRRRFDLFVPDTEGRDRLAVTREAATDLAMTLAEGLPEGRAKSLAMTHLEEALMWASRAIVEGPASPR